MAQANKIWTARLENLGEIANEIALILNASRVTPFVLWLRGELGAGKTTFAGELLHALGVDRKVPVLSPTFTYMTEYQAGPNLVAHMDLYRLIDGDEDSIETLLSGREFKGLIIEWPERAEGSDLIQRTHELKFTQSNDGESRHMELQIIL